MTLHYDHLVGIPFLMGRDDCLGLTRRFYRDNFEIEIRDLARPADWSSNNIDLIRMLHAAEGFEMIADWRIKDLRPGDLLAMCIGEQNPNHLAIVVDDNQILHHLVNSLSRVEILRDFWRSSVGFVLRHPAVPDLRPVYPDVDIGTLLNARYNLKADGGGDA